MLYRLEKWNPLLSPIGALRVSHFSPHANAKCDFFCTDGAAHAWEQFFKTFLNVNDLIEQNGEMTADTKAGRRTASYRRKAFAGWRWTVLCGLTLDCALPAEAERRTINNSFARVATKCVGYWLPAKLQKISSKVQQANVVIKWWLSSIFTLLCTASPDLINWKKGSTPRMMLTNRWRFIT